MQAVADYVAQAWGYKSYGEMPPGNKPNVMKESRGVVASIADQIANEAELAGGHANPRDFEIAEWLRGAVQPQVPSPRWVKAADQHMTDPETGDQWPVFVENVAERYRDAYRWRRIDPSVHRRPEAVEHPEGVPDEHQVAIVLADALMLYEAGEGRDHPAIDDATWQAFEEVHSVETDLDPPSVVIRLSNGARYRATVTKE